MGNENKSKYAIIAGKQLRKARIARGYKKQSQLASEMSGQANTSATIISRMETGKNTEFKQYVRAAQALKVTLKYIFTENAEVPEEVYNDPFLLEERVAFDLEKIGKLIRKNRKGEMKVLVDYEKAIGVGLDSSNASKIERGKSNIKLSTLELILSEVNMKIEDLI